MTNSLCAIVLAAAVAAACTQIPPEQQIVNDAAAALGGRERIEAVNTLVLEGSATGYNMGQDMTPDASGQTFTDDPYRRVIDMRAWRARVERTRTPNFEYFQGRAPQTQTPSLDDEVYHHPVAALRAALEPAATFANARSEGGESLVSVTRADGSSFTLAIDPSTKLPTRVISATNNAVLGDVSVATGFANYLDVDGLKLPTRLTTKTDDFTNIDIRLTRQGVNGEAGSFAARPTTSETAPTVAVEEIGPGLWLLAGQSHHSVVAEFGDHLMLIEAPSEARTLAVIARARELRPNKPLTQVVNSHHHFDHSGGIRAAVSEGLTVFTHRANAAFFEDLAARPHTRVPDALQKKPAQLKLQSVDDELVLKDETAEVRLYHIAGNPHGDAMLMAYFPRERVIVEADAYSPGRPHQPYAANLLENITRRNLRVDRIVPVHGKPVAYAELVKAVQAMRASTSN